ncbi:MAG: SMP-30/gluconolactonase/LRE family protein [Oceanicoccus sp.]|uniref:SMP-30/gluconolactonase/LRE family protein n=1 Tax=Oceanicoccus sp. TaxID=2691044 RepID=UPI0026033673|nr:SMP-30/gluconolactonase/LRE family protein [Oceanicoccus sp.]MDG1773770.1 SMP-30/gluconolactonase/LRE family protein [Oceanicoccus sp.]
MLKASLVVITTLFTYLLFWPVAIDPVSWDAPVSQGYTGSFQQNDLLKDIEEIELSDTHGPEGLALINGEIYMATREGWILRYNESTGVITKVVNTLGSPLGLAVDANNNLIIADAYKGLLSMSLDGELTLLTNSYDGLPLEYIDDLDITADGKIYFSDASGKFGAEKYGGTYPSSLLDILEHGGHGRLLVYNPADQTTHVVIDGLNFANGVATAEDSSFVFVVETGSYRIHKYWLQGEKAGTSDILIDNLPGFPDNIVRGRAGRFWVGLVSPRNKELDTMSSVPLMRKILQRLPKSMSPAAQAYSHVFAMDKDGNVLTSLQDPKGMYHTNTGAVETDDWLYISSLHAANLGRISKKRAGIQ